MGKVFLELVIKKVVDAIVDAIADYFKWKQKAREDQAKAKEILNEKDPQVRASRMRDFLSN